MKVAICLYGQPRLYELGYKNISNFIKSNSDVEFDFFFHTYYSDELVGTYYECSNWRQINRDELLIKANIINTLIELYKPIDYMYEKPIDKSYYDNLNIEKSLMFLLSKNSVKNSNYNNTISNIYSKYRVSSIFEKYSINNRK